jgi:pantoate--beta-alanine ligase
MPRPAVAKTVPALRRTGATWHKRGDTIALVPTMGALHAGHLALVKLARRKARRVVASIFVNPTQFAPNEDFAAYPRTFDADLSALAEAGVDLVWAPTAGVMYPPGFATRIDPQGPAKAGLEDAFRPHFFGGVATVVAKLFTQVQPDFAIFGEKDYQQLRVVMQLARDLDLPVTVVGAPTMREKDGLAMSSRNAYLSAEDRATAPVLYRVLQECAADIVKGEKSASVLGRGRSAIEKAGFVLDYLELRDAVTLAPVVVRASEPLRLLVAARIGKTRLIDNIKC